MVKTKKNLIFLFFFLIYFFIKYVDPSVARNLLNHKEIILEYSIDLTDKFCYLNSPINWKVSKKF